MQRVPRGDWTGLDEEMEQQGKPRLYAPGDFVRIEIESALKRKIQVISVLVSGLNPAG